MHPCQTTKRCVAVLLLMLAVLLPSFAAAAASDWEQLYPGYPTHGFNDIYAAGPTNAFAVGDFGLIYRFNGATWATMTSPVSTNLNAVWGRSANDIFAVGDSGTILHYNGSAWQAMASPTSDNLHSVWGFATPGYPVYAGGRDGDILKYNGGTWSFMQTGLSDGDFDYTIIYGIWGYSITNLYAVGYKTGDNTEDIYLKSTDGSTWQQFTGPTGSDIPAATFPVAIWGSVGGNMYVGGKSGIYRLTNGAGSWSANLYPGEVADIWGNSPTDLWAAGGGIAHFDGASWTSVSLSIDPANLWGGLNGVSGSGSANVLAVGDAGRILRYQGSAWSSMTTVPEYTIYDLWRDSDTSLTAVGENGLVIHSDGETWRPMASATNQHLNAVCGWGNGHYLAAGVGGTVQYYNGATWTLVNSTTTENLHDVWCLAPDAAFVVGTNGTILNCDGAGCFAENTDGNAATLNAVYSSTLGSYATGAGGVLMRKDSPTWNTVTPTTPIFNSFTDLWGDVGYGGLIAVGDQFIYSYNIASNTWTEEYRDPNIMYLLKVVGDSFANLVIAGYGGPYPYSGMVLYRSGGTFQTLKNFSPTYYPYTVQGSPAGNLFVGGAQLDQNSQWHGQIQHFDGSAWTSMIETNSLNDIWGGDLNNVFTVGYNGTILHYDGNSVQHMESNTATTLGAVFAGETGGWAAAAGWSGDMLFFDGATWAPAFNPTTSGINDLWGQGDTVYGVGDSGTILQSGNRGETWNTMISPTTEYLNGIWGASMAGPLFAVGNNGTVLKYTGGNWSTMASNAYSSIDLNAVWGSSAGDVYAVGDNWPFLGSNETQIIHYDGSSWKESYYSYNVLPPKYLTGIWGRSAKDIIAFGTPNLRKQCGRAWGEASAAGIPPLQKGWGKMDPDGNYHIFGITAYDSIYRYTIPASEDCSSPWTLFLPAIITHKK